MTHTIQHALLLVNNLLEFHSSNLNETPVPASIPFNVYILFNDIYESFKPLAQSKGLDFYYHTPGKDNPFCNGDYVGDPVRIRQCVENLISNAIKFTPKGKIELFVRIVSEYKSDNTLSIILRDEGPGIPEDKIGYVFQEFTRLEHAKGTEGFGLGLSVTCHLLKQMNGKIICRSPYGRGANFVSLYL
ncbi:MAG: HAMP domain-containing histidine kinase [Tannerellaceae bacterium]|nr:HAMP domain-containing histidine kinase [Tannerellaceae bacterium]